MAHGTGLTASGPSGLRLVALAAGVLAAHLGLLAWLAGQADDPPALRQMADPMLTRLLAPAPPPPVPPTPGAGAAPAPATGAMTGALVARPARPKASAPKARPPPPPAPDTVPEPTAEPAPEPAVASASPPEAGASEPVATASMPSSSATAPEAAASVPVATAQATPPADTWPRDTRLTYQLGGQFRGGPLYGGAHVQWQREGSRYEARVKIDIVLAGSRVLTSQGEATPQGLVPQAYEELRGSRRRSVQLTPTEVVLTDGRQVPRPEQVQDTASQFVELGHRFATGRQALALGGTVEVWLARPGGVELWTYDVIAQDLLRTPRLGEVMAWRLAPRRTAHPSGNLTAEMWFAPSLQYLPVRIRISLGDEAQVDLMVDTIEQR